MHASELQPIGPWVLVERQQDAAESIGGLAIPELARTGGKPGRGTVVSVGAGVFTKKGVRIAPDVKVGDRVVFSRLTGHEIEGLPDHVLVHEEELLAVIDPDTRIDPVVPTADGADAW